MRNEMAETITEVQRMVLRLLDDLDRGAFNAEEMGAQIQGMAEIVRQLQPAIEAASKKYENLLNDFLTFGAQCVKPDFLTQRADALAELLIRLTQCLGEVAERYENDMRICPICGNEVLYLPLPPYYAEKRRQYGFSDQVRSETLNREEYTCPQCGASDRDRLMVSFLKQEGLQEAAEGFRLLQIAPAPSISHWIETYCPQVEYETTDLLMEDVTFQSDVMDMKEIADETYDVILCSHVLEHVRDDRKALRELKRCLKPDGKILFLVPVDLNAARIDEAWGLSEAENWRRFGQGDHCRRYSRSGLLQRLSEVFTVHALGKEYFGEAVFRACGLTDTSTLYVLTKSADIPLKLAEEPVIDSALCREGPLVSVIMSCYNHAEFVAEAIESVIGQSYQQIEFLVADDGSDDGSAEVMQRYAAHFAKAFYFSENAGGRYDQLKQYATGKYIALMNSDDVWAKDKLALQVAYMERHEECGACLTWCQYTDENLRELNNPIFLKKNRDSSAWMRYFWEYGNTLCHPSSLLRREYGLETRKHGRACKQLPDFFKWVDLVQRTSLYVLPRVLIYMRRHPNSRQQNVSSATGDNRIRCAMEEGCGWLDVIRDMEDDFFRKTFRDQMRDPQADTPEELQCEKYFLLLSHRNLLVQHSAYCYLYGIYNEVEACLRQKYHYTRKDIAADIIAKGMAPMLKALR